ncbi:hypothetical protein LSAT2_004080 [Lamellibrachia satsuma]|nr:hypothetical protein LSAT2_004080 [Lamellibrachia satsuma]
MGPGQDPMTHDPADTDPAGFLQVILNCKLFAGLVDATKVQAVRDVRNAVMHSAKFEVTSADLTAYLTTMTTLLQEPAVHKYASARRAIVEITKVMAQHLVCGNCSNWVDFVKSGCEKSWTEVQADSFSFECRGCAKMKELEVEMEHLRQLVVVGMGESEGDRSKGDERERCHVDGREGDGQKAARGHDCRTEWDGKGPPQELL